MTNGIVNGTGLENQFGTSPTPLQVARPPHLTSSPSASLGINGTRTAYVPPHMRNQQRAASTPAVPTNGYVMSPSSVAVTHKLRRNGWNDSRSPTPSRGFGGRGGYSDRGGGGVGNGFPRGGGGGGGGWSSDRERTPSTNGWYGSKSEGGRRGGELPGYGSWKEGIHMPGARSTNMEKELYGDANDPSKQHTGINFEKYDDIPVEATGAGVPEPVNAFTNPPLDPVLDRKSTRQIGRAHV